jgi:predicted ATPase
MIGRADELRALTAQVGAGSRLTTIFGPGGIGKTTLARALVSKVPRAIFVPLSAAADLDQSTELVARALELKANTNAQLQAVLRLRFADGAILVLDNLEHLPGVAEMIDAWTDEAPRLSIVATSRARLGLPYEHVVELSPLSPSESVSLFLGRAGTRAPDQESLAAIDRIVRALEGVPLALELAAARARDVPLDELAERASDVRWVTGETRVGVERHRSIDALVDWSWSLLDAKGREALVELSAFNGGMSFQLAEERWPELARLREYALVSFSGGRYRLLEIVRAFVASKTDTSAARRRHAELFVAEAERRRALLPVARAAIWLRDEVDNLRAAAAFARSDPAFALRAALALHAALAVNELPLRPDVLESALSLGGEPIDRARAVTCLAACRWLEGSTDTQLAEHAWELAQAHGDVETQAYAAGTFLRQLGSCGRGPEGAAIARRFFEPIEGVDARVSSSVRTAAMHSLPVREFRDSYPRWFSRADSDPSDRERSYFALVLALAGEPERALDQLPESGAHAEWARPYVLFAADRFAEAAAAHQQAAAVAHGLGERRLTRWHALLAAIARCVLGDVDEARSEIDASIDDFVALGPETHCALIAAALVGSRRARALLALRRTDPDFERYELELDVFDALEGRDLERAGSALRVLEERLLALPPNDAIDALVVHRAARARLTAPVRRTLFVGPNTGWFRLGDGEAVSLERYEGPRGILAALLGSEQDADALFAAGWPGERARRDAQHNRVRVTLARLRKLGLETAIERGPTGWRLTRDIDVVHSSDDARHPRGG